MSDLQKLEAINQAVTIIRDYRTKAAAGSIHFWRVLDHAINHLDKEIAELLAE